MDFSEIYNEAVTRAGSHEKLMELLPKPCSSDLLSKISDDRYLSTMARCIFRAGFVWRVVDNKWPNFEEVFLNFNPLAVAYLSDERLEEIATYKSIIRHPTKILATRTNAAYIIEKEHEYGSYANYIASWPSERVVELWRQMKKEGSRLGGMTGPLVLRIIGKDTFLATNDVLVALKKYGYIKTHSNGSMKDLFRLQEIFNEISKEIKMPLCQISKIFALSTLR